ncbi:MAG: hypothetical protein M1813_005804 [Trichoglossum hirsutum]|nr:MAG: hypothetical protein M1813_005804 [Trichoglossum hirsutum]
MDLVSITASVFTVLQVAGKVISICYDYRKGIKEAPKDLIRLTAEVTSLRDVLESLARLEENADARGPSRLPILQLLNKPDGPLTGCQAELEALEKKLAVTSGWKAIGKALLDEVRQKIHQWLSAPDPSSNHNAACKKRQSTTGLWLVGRSQFTHWKLDAARRYYGNSTIIEDVISHCLADSTAGVVYFYFDFNDVKKQYQENLIRSLITQLSAQSAKPLKL